MGGTQAYELGSQLSAAQRLSLVARATLGVAAIALLGWYAGLPALCAVPLAFWWLSRLRTLFEAPTFKPAIVLTETDAQRLCTLLEALPPERRRALTGLELELERAQVVRPHQIPGDVVTMNSLVRFEELHSGVCSEARLVYPSPEVAQQDQISVLAPAGSALLGLAVGQPIDWRMPNGSLRRYRVVELLYQPEAAGELQL